MGVPPNWEIPEEIQARLSNQSGRQRAMVADGHIVMVLHRVPHRREHKREGVLFWRNPGGDWECNQGRPGFAKLKQLVDDYNTAILAIERAHGAATSADDWFQILEEVGPLCRAAKNLYDTLQEARKSIPDVRQRKELQGPCDLASDVARASELLQTEARDALEFHIAKQSELQSALSRDLAHAGHRLNAMACIFLPLAAIAGVFGMNLKHGLEGSPIWVFWAVLTAGVFVGCTITGLLSAVQGIRQDGSLQLSRQTTLRQAEPPRSFEPRRLESSRGGRI